MDAIDQLNRITAGFIARRGRPPSDWREVVVEQRWSGVPVDGTGMAFTLDAVTGRWDCRRTHRCRRSPTHRRRPDRDARHLARLCGSIGRVHRQLLERRHLPAALGTVAGVAALAMPAMRLPPGVVRQCPDRRLAAAERA